MTQYTEALSGTITPEMIAVAQSEFFEPEFIRKEIAEGRLVIPANKVHLQKNLQPIGIGIALRTKINANLGNSALTSNADEQQNNNCTRHNGSSAYLVLTGMVLYHDANTIMLEFEVTRHFTMLRVLRNIRTASGVRQIRNRQTAW